MNLKSFFDEELFNENINKIRSLNDELKKESIHKSMLTWIKWLKEKNKITSKKYEDLVSKLEKESTIFLNDKNNPPMVNSFSQYRSLLPVLITLIILCFGLITYLFVTLNKIKSVGIEEKKVGRVLPFKGNIKQSDGSALDTKRDAVFRLYNVPSKGNVLYTGSCLGQNGLEPSFNGSFTILVGSDCGMKPIPESIFDENNSLYLGVSIGNEPEFEPRYQIMTSSFSQDSTKLQGLSIGNSKSTIPFINDEGNIELTNESPSIKSTNGTFTVEGSALTLRTNKEGSNIIFDPASSSNVIIGSGNLGIGTYNPETYLDVSGNKLIGSIVSLSNLAREDSAESSILKLSLGTDPSGSNGEFIEFYAGKNELTPGMKVGGVRLNNQSVVYETSAADFAEYFKVDDTSEFELFQIVSITKNGVKPASINENLIGVVSNTAGYIGNNKYSSDNSVLVALVGQVEVLVTNINGDIHIGDRVGSSLIKGYGSKNTNKDNAIGYALEESTSLSNENCPLEVKQLKTISNQQLKCGTVRTVLAID